MNNTPRFRRAAIAVTAAAVLPLALSACGGDGSKKDSSASSSEASAPAGAQSSSGSDTSMTDRPFGAACASVPKDGAGSFDGMAERPGRHRRVATTRLLSTLVTAVKKAGLVDTLNNAQNITVFAPTNDAFAKIPQGRPGQGARRQGHPHQDPHVPRGRRKLAPHQLARQPRHPEEGHGQGHRLRHSFKVNGMPRWSAATCRPPTRPSTSSTPCCMPK